tara:strand:+ start:738 stop:1697 length:960 start_codon:yes stop_codon:yes gene_type:complete
MKKNILKESQSAIDKAVALLKSRKLVSIKTETVYGVACDPSNIYSIKKVYQLKKRPLYNPLIIHVSSMKMAEEIAVFSNDAKNLAKNFWPGPMTLILPKRQNEKIHDFAVSGLNTIAIRIPKSKIFQEIINQFKRPLAAPSANESGYISATDAQHVIDSFGNQVELVIDSGRSALGLESTIVDLTTNSYLIRRLGVIDEREILKVTKIKVRISKNQKNNLKPNSPGQLEKHYAPKTPLQMNVKKPQKDDAFLDFGKKTLMTHSPYLNLSKNSNLNEAAYNLFDYLRKLDKLRKKRIAVAPIPNQGIGKTINERLCRASV